MTEMVSLKERLAERREQLQQERTFVIPVQGYEDLLAARYKVLPYEELRKIGKRNERLVDTPEGELAVAADTLVNASIELLEKNERGEYVSLAHRWGPKAANEFFGAELPEDATARDALFAVLPGTALMMHFSSYDEHLATVMPEIEEAVRGNSEASSVED